MASSGPRYPGTIAPNGSGDFSFDDLSKFGAADASFALADWSLPFGGAATDFVQSTVYGFSIPVGSTINGIVAEINGKVNSGVGSFSSVRLVKAGSPVGSNLAAGSLTGSATTYQFGGAANLWGTTWSVSEINNSGFGVGAIFSADDAFTQVAIDYMRLTVYYTVATSSSPAAMMIVCMSKLLRPLEQIRRLITPPRRILLPMGCAL